MKWLEEGAAARERTTLELWIYGHPTLAGMKYNGIPLRRPRRRGYPLEPTVCGRRS
jgi:hypothetical protein